jgi:hypothetical protein
MLSIIKQAAISSCDTPSRRIAGLPFPIIGNSHEVPFGQSFVKPVSP